MIANSKDKAKGLQKQDGVTQPVSVLNFKAVWSWESLRHLVHMASCSAVHQVSLLPEMV